MPFLSFSRFLYLPPTPTYDVTAATIFCHAIWSGRLAFDMGYISVYTCVALTIERWFAVVRPTTYRSAQTKHAVHAVILVWFIGPAVNYSTYFRIKYIVEEKRCAWTSIPFAHEEMPWVSLAIQSIIPYTTMVVLYGHIYYTLKKLPRLTSSRDIQLRRITVVALVACSALIVGWVPGRVTFMLTKFGHLDPNGSIHFTCVMITFLNSCVNPFLYAIYSPAFREEYKEVFRYYYRKTVNVFQHSTVKPTVGAGQDNQLPTEKLHSEERKPSQTVKQSAKLDNVVGSTNNQRQRDSATPEYNRGFSFNSDPDSARSDSIILKPSNLDWVPDDSGEISPDKYSCTGL